MLRLINSMVTELIRSVNYNSDISQKLIKLEISCRCSQLECNEESDETEGYSDLYTSLLPLSYQLPLRPLFCLFSSGGLGQILLYCISKQRRL